MPISNLRIQWHWLLIFLMLCLSMSNTLAAAEASAEPGKVAPILRKKQICAESHLKRTVSTRFSRRQRMPRFLNMR
ncbi:MAG: hypothetical protein U1F16_05240 [Turneriella sp.]